jgi:elongation factor Ts
MAITALMVKDLREKSGAGMMDSKRALVETKGDMEAAIDWLRTKGLAKAAKKSGRTAAEGLVAVQVSGGRGVVVEVNSETDFVAKNEEFQTMVASIASAAVGASDLEALAATDINGKSVTEMMTDKIATIGENMALRRMGALEGTQVVSYIHNAAAAGMGKIGVLVALSAQNEAFGRQVAMHIAAANPQSLGADDLDPVVIEREKNVLSEQARETGKPEQVIEKMIVGRMKKFLAEVTLLGQAFVINPDLSVATAASEAGVEILGFLRFEVGEGIDKKVEDFAAEVAKTAQG